jgi:hypothetical protein
MPLAWNGRLNAGRLRLSDAKLPGEVRAIRPTVDGVRDRSHISPGAQRL